MEEKWEDINGYEGLYQISTNSVIRSYPRTWYSGKNNCVVKSHNGCILKQSKAKGYLVVTLCKDGKEKNVKVHVLLATAFKENPNKYQLVRHLNDIKTDNRLENLCWGTEQDNADDRVKNGNSLKNGNNPNSILVIDTSTGIFYDTIKEAAESRNLPPKTLAIRLSGGLKNNTPFRYA